MARPRFDMSAALARIEIANPTIAIEKPDNRPLFERLPEPISAKVRRLSDAAEEGLVIRRVAHERVSDLTQERIAAKTKLDEHIRSLSRTIGYSQPGAIDADENVQRMREKVERIDEELARRRKAAETRDVRVSALDGLARNLREHAERLTSFDMQAPPAAKLGKGESREQAVARIRDEIAGMRDELAKLSRAPLPATDAKARISSYVDQLAERGRPQVGNVLAGGEPTFPKTKADFIEWIEVNGHLKQRVTPPTVNTTDTLGVLAWLYADDMKAALEAEIDALADDTTALTPDERRAREAEIKAQILVAERMEEALIESAEEAGSEILRRADADYRAVLGLADATPAPRD